MSIINSHPEGEHPFATSLKASDVVTDSGIAHRELIERGNIEAFIILILPNYSRDGPSWCLNHRKSCRCEALHITQRF